MDLLIDSAVGNAMFSFMDGFNGYNHIRIVPRDVEKTTFKTPIDNFYYTVMQFWVEKCKRNLPTHDDRHIPRYDVSQARRLCR